MKAQKNTFSVLKKDCDFVTAAHAIIAGGLKRRIGLDIQKHYAQLGYDVAKKVHELSYP